MCFKSFFQRCFSCCCKRKNKKSKTTVEKVNEHFAMQAKTTHDKPIITCVLPTSTQDVSIEPETDITIPVTEIDNSSDTIVAESLTPKKPEGLLKFVRPFRTPPSISCTEPPEMFIKPFVMTPPPTPPETSPEPQTPKNTIPTIKEVPSMTRVNSEVNTSRDAESLPVNTLPAGSDPSQSEDTSFGSYEQTIFGVMKKDSSLSLDSQTFLKDSSGNFESKESSSSDDPPSSSTVGGGIVGKNGCARRSSSGTDFSSIQVLFRLPAVAEEPSQGPSQVSIVNVKSTTTSYTDSSIATLSGSIVHESDKRAKSGNSATNIFIESIEDVRDLPQCNNPDWLEYMTGQVKELYKN